MEKLLFLVDQGGVNRSVFNFACYVAEITNSPLTGLFLDISNNDQNKKFALQNAPSSKKADRVNEADSQTSLVEHERAFGLSCSNRGIRWSNIDWPVKDPASIIEETRFADLLIISGEASLKRSESPPTNLLVEVLCRSECPVIVAPADFEGIEEIIFAYDGSPSSIFAIKQFTYLFPKLSETRVVYLQVASKDEPEITAQDELNEYLKTHYSKISSHVLAGDNPGDELFSYILERKNTLIVMGAYGRNAISRAFKKSTSDLFLVTNHLPVFVSHR